MHEKYSHLNPLETVTLEKSYNHSLWMKLQHAFYLFLGSSEFTEGPISIYGQNSFQNTIRSNRFRAGFLDFFPFFFLPKYLWIAIRWLWEEREYEPFKTAGLRVLAFLLGLVTVPLLSAQALISLILTIISSPIVLLVHVFVGPGYQNGKPALRQSLFFNPFTWGSAALMAALIVLLLQGVSSIAFAQAIMPLAILQSVFLVMTALTLLYTVGCWLVEKPIQKVKQRDETESESSSEHFNFLVVKVRKPTQNLTQIRTLVSVYIQEYIDWIKENRLLAGMILIFGLALLCAGIAFTVIYFDGGAAGTWVAQLFDYLGQAIRTTIQAISSLDADLTSAGEILSAVTLMSSAILGAVALIRMGKWLFPLDQKETVDGYMCEEFIDEEDNNKGFIEGSIYVYQTEYANEAENSDSDSPLIVKIVDLIKTDHVVIDDEKFSDPSSFFTQSISSNPA